MQPNILFFDESEVLREARRLQATEGPRLVALIVRSLGAVIARCIPTAAALWPGLR